MINYKYLFWLERAVIGLFNIFKMVVRSYYVVETEKNYRDLAIFFRVPFFVVHFGGFMAVHLFLIITLFGGQESLPKVANNPLPFF